MRKRDEIERSEHSETTPHVRPNIIRDAIQTVFGIVFEIFRSVWRTCFPRQCKQICDDVVLISGGGKGLGRLLAVKLADCKPKHVRIRLTRYCIFISNQLLRRFCR